MAQPIDVVVVGNALNSEGFVASNWNVTGIDLITFGFLTPCDGIWTPTDSALTTVWTASHEAVTNTEVCSGG